MLKIITDTRILKKFALYIAVFIGGYGGVLAFFLGCMWLSYYYFDSPIPFFLLLFGLTGLSGIFMIAKEKVDRERMNEQHHIDLVAAKLKADEEHQVWREQFKKRFGQYP